MEDVKSNSLVFDVFIQKKMRHGSMVIKTRFRYVYDTPDYDDYYQASIAKMPGISQTHTSRRLSKISEAFTKAGSCYTLGIDIAV